MRIFRFISPLSLIALVLLIGVTGCAKAPDDAIIKAEDAIKKAVMAGAEEASPRLLGKARVSLNEARALADQGHFADARKKAEDAEMQALQAEKNAVKTGGKPLEHAGEPHGAGAQGEGTEGEVNVSEGGGE